MTSVLIIGSTSTVGLALGQFLSSSCEVFYAGRRDADYFLDLENPGSDFGARRKFDVVVNAAAHFGGISVPEQIEAEKVNALGAINVCEIARQVQAKRLIMISSMSANYSSADAYFGTYSLSKRHGDELAQLYCDQKELPLTILRPSQLYDADSLCRKHQSLFYSIVDNAEKGEDIRFYGTNDASRNLLYLDDFCDIVAGVIKHDVGGVFSCAFPESVTLSEIADIAYQVFSQGGKVIFDADKPDIADLPDFPQGNLYHLIGYTPKTDLKFGIEMIKKARQVT
ncbi:MAG: NAD(P)-dependent oxidoreductase [Acidiferrobacterales bacterium]|nr:NAD(P)-dependent oxidoreductase [Acidiferrobacterales bacterium]